MTTEWVVGVLMEVYDRNEWHEFYHTVTRNQIVTRFVPFAGELAGESP